MSEESVEDPHHHRHQCAYLRLSCTACWRLTWSSQGQCKKGFDIKGSNFSDRDLERHEAKRDIWRVVLDGIDEIKAGGGKRSVVLTQGNHGNRGEEKENHHGPDKD